MKLELVHVIVHPEGDGQEGLYLDGEQIVAGDEYHNDIAAYIKGFLHGVACLGWDRRYKKWTAEAGYGESLMEDSMPEYLDEFDTKRMKRKQLNWGD